MWNKEKERSVWRSLCHKLGHFLHEYLLVGFVFPRDSDIISLYLIPKFFVKHEEQQLLNSIFSVSKQIVVPIE